MVLYRTSIILMLVILAGFYTWITLRSDPRLSTIPMLPHAVTQFFDLNPLSRNFPAFAVMGILAAALVAGLPPPWQHASLAVCLLAPVAKDVAQLLTQTRHFHWGAVMLGILGAAAGWSATYYLIGRWFSPK